MVPGNKPGVFLFPGTTTHPYSSLLFRLWELLEEPVSGSNNPVTLLSKNTNNNPSTKSNIPPQNRDLCDFWMPLCVTF